MSKTTLLWNSLVVLLVCMAGLSPRAAAQVFQLTTAPQIVRVEGLAETVGSTALTATTAATLPANSALTFTYSGTLSNAPGNSALSGSFLGIPCAGCGFTVSSSGNVVTVSNSTGVTFAIGDTIYLSQVRINVNAIPGVANGTVINVTVEDSGISFINPTTQGIGFVIAPSLSVSVTPALAQLNSNLSVQPFSVAVGERYPAALTTIADETLFTPSAYSPPVIIGGTNFTVTLSGVPANFIVAFTGQSVAPLTGSLMVTSPASQMSIGPGFPLAFVFTVIGSNTTLRETTNLGFTLSPPVNSIPSLVASVTATVEIGPVTSTATVVPRFASNSVSGGTVALIYSPCAALLETIASRTGTVGGLRDWNITFMNNGANLASGVTITSATVTKTAGPACSAPVVTSTPPLFVGDVPAGNILSAPPSSTSRVALTPLFLPRQFPTLRTADCVLASSRLRICSNNVASNEGDKPCEPATMLLSLFVPDDCVLGSASPSQSRP